MSWGSSVAEQANCNGQGGGSIPIPQHHIICGHQPVYLPGIIFFNKIAQCDALMFVGHCDYQPKSWHSRNFIRGSQSQPSMLSVPVRKGVSINETVPLPDPIWRHKHLRSIELRYSYRPYFKDYYPEIRDTLLLRYESLSDLNIALIHVLMYMLEIDTRTYRSEDFQIFGHKTAMLADICAKLGADHYLSSPGEVAYFRHDQMNGYGHSFQQFTHPIYEQGAKTFLPNLSVIDLLFNMGPEAAKIVRQSGKLG